MRRTRDGGCRGLFSESWGVEGSESATKRNLCARPHPALRKGSGAGRRWGVVYLHRRGWESDLHLGVGFRAGLSFRASVSLRQAGGRLRGRLSTFSLQCDLLEGDAKWVCVGVPFRRGCPSFVLARGVLIGSCIIHGSVEIPSEDACSGWAHWTFCSRQWGGPIHTGGLFSSSRALQSSSEGIIKLLVNGSLLGAGATNPFSIRRPSSPERDLTLMRAGAIVQDRTPELGPVRGSDRDRAGDPPPKGFHKAR